MEKRKVVYGCGGHGRSIVNIILYNTPDSDILFIDENAQENERVFGFPVVKQIPFSKHYEYIVGIGDNIKRREQFFQIPRENIVSVISKTALLGFECKIGIGSFLAHLCHIGPQAVIGDNTIINTCAVIEHEVQVGEHCHIGPNASISGRSKIGDLVFVGVGATIIDKITICSNTIIGAGATVVKDILEPGIYIGTPARRVK